MNRLRTIFWLLAVCLGWLCFPARAKIQFDVFPGFEGRFARAGAWFPVAFEIFNDGPSFDGIIELSDNQAAGYSVQIPVELPSNTRKILTLSLFCPSTSYYAVDARLRDSKGKLRDERLSQKIDVVAWEGTLLGALPATFSGSPTFPELPRIPDQSHIAAPRIEPAFFPDSPLPLECLNAVYLNTASALKLKEPQIEALLSWLHSGGHLIVGVDQPGDLNALTWLRLELPARVGDTVNRTVGSALEEWVQGIRGVSVPDAFGYAAPVAESVENGLQPVSVKKYGNKSAPQVEPPAVKKTAGSSKSTGSPADDDSSPFNRKNPDEGYSPLPGDSAFRTNDCPIYSLKVNLGHTLLGLNKNGVNLPLIVTHARDHGQLTLLAFNPEREPLKSWKGRPFFWARMAGIPGHVLAQKSQTKFGGISLDSIFGAMIETRQVRKLPIGALLLLLVGYLVVIGPLDQWWLRKLNRPMLTWITFPTYVVLFFLLIYVIGYKLRAGKAEWNEFHVVDVLPQAAEGRAALRGRTYVSLYSPANETYPFAAELTQVALRPESQGLYESGNLSAKRTTVVVKPTRLSAEVAVDIWTSQLNVIEWQEYAAVPLRANWGSSSNILHLDNLTDNAIDKVWVVSNGQIFHFPGLAAHRGDDFTLRENAGERLFNFVRDREATFTSAASQRGQAFGGNEKTHIDEWPQSTIAASFYRMMQNQPQEGRGFIAPPGLDLTALERRGDTLVFASVTNHSLIGSLRRFKTPQSQQNTVLRLALPTPPSVTVPTSTSP